ncbi:MAG: hypothetical protein LBC70_06535 [Chitinispirillales bacterium]|nr:hypothetical protein [Chitinispirillales bacterium]
MAAKKRNREISVLEQKFAENPRSRVFSRLADLYRETGDLDGAIAVCVSGLAEHPEYITGRLVLGRCYKERKNFSAAIDELTKVCAADERNLAAIKMLAEIYTAQGHTETAGSLYGILYTMEPDNPVIQQAAAKNKHRSSGSVHEILGIEPPAPLPRQQENATGEVAATAGDAVEQQSNAFTEQAIAFPTESEADDIAQNYAGGIGAVTGSDVENQLNSMFGGEGETLSIPADGLDLVTGSDVESQINSMFGKEGETLSIPADGLEMLTGSDIENQIDSMFGGGGETLPVPADGQEMLTGSDVESKLDALFGEQAAATIASAQSTEEEDAALGIDEADGGIDEAAVPTGSDVENQLNALFGESAATAPAAEEADSSVSDQLFSLFGDDDPDATLTIDAAEIDLPETPDIADALAIIDFPETPDITAELMAGIDLPESADIADELMIEADLPESIDIIGSLEVDADLSEPIDAADELMIDAYLSKSTDIADELTIETNLPKSISIDDEPLMDDVIENRIDELFGASKPDIIEHDGEEALIFDSGDSGLPPVIDEAPDETPALIADETDEIIEQADEPAARQEDSDEISSEDMEARLAELFGEGQNTEELPEGLAAELASYEEQNSDERIGLSDEQLSALSAELAAYDEELESGEIAALPEALPEESSIELPESSEELPEEISAELASYEEQNSDERVGLSDDQLAALSAELAAYTDDTENTDTGAEAEDAIDTGNIDNIDNMDDSEVGILLPPQPQPTAEDKPAAAVDDVQEKIRQLFMSEEPDLKTIDIGTMPDDDDEAASAFDERDTPFDLPDHVLTSTLADIYYQQGQPRLALHIYERLALRDPEDTRLQDKIEDIKDALLQTDPGDGVFDSEVSESEKADGASSGRKKKGAVAKDDRRPLAGVRIKKKDTGPKKTARKKT